MFDFLFGFILGIGFTIGTIVFGVYKLLLRFEEPLQKDARIARPLPAYTSMPHIHLTSLKSHIKHSISKHSPEENGVNIETCTWLNTIAASICVEALSSPILVESLHTQLHDILNNPADKPDALGKIVISDINLGSGLPSIEGIRVLSRTPDDSLQAEIGVLYTGGASFTISTELYVNWPTPKFASLPVSLHASFDHFEGTLSTHMKWRSPDKSRFMFYFRQPPIFQLRIGSSIGHTTKLVNVLQISSLLENMIYSFVNKELVAPNGFEVELENGKVSAVRKLQATSPQPPVLRVQSAAQVGMLEKENRVLVVDKKNTMIAGDLSRRSFSAYS